MILKDVFNLCCDIQKSDEGEIVFREMESCVLCIKDPSMIKEITGNSKSEPFVLRCISEKKVSGKIIVEGEIRGKKYPLVVCNNNQYIFLFNPLEVIEYYRDERGEYNNKIPVFLRLPFNIDALPENIKTFIGNHISRKENKEAYAKIDQISIVDLLYLIINYCYKSDNKMQKCLSYPKKKKYAVLLSHDIESNKIQNNVKEIIAIEEKYDLKSTSFFVTNSFKINNVLLEYIVESGNEVACHGYLHDMKLIYLSSFARRKRFVLMKERLADYNVVGFRSPAWLRCDEMFEELSEFFIYDSSMLDYDRFSYSYQWTGRDGCHTVFPFKRDKILEIPVTILPELPVLLKLNINMLQFWKMKIDLIKNIGGVIHIMFHPGKYGQTKKKEFCELFEYILDGEYCNCTLKEFAMFWNQNVLR